jgi:hypothetical protein
VHAVTDKRYRGMSYDWETGSLTFQTNDGRRYSYGPVPPRVYFHALCTPSLSYFLSDMDAERPWQRYKRQSMNGEHPYG